MRRRPRFSSWLSLEDRTVPSAAFDVVGLTALRNDPAFDAIDGALPNGSRVGVAVLDTGVFANHNDLRDNFVAFYDAVNRQEGNLTQAYDPQGHGTHVSGTAVSSNPNYGVATEGGLIGVRVLVNSQSELPNYDPVLEGLNWVERNAQRYNIRVVNMSLGFSGVNQNTSAVNQQTTAYSQAVARLENLGITVVSAAGNSYAVHVALGASVPAVYSTLSVVNTWAESRFAGSVGGSPGDQFLAYEGQTAVDRIAATSQRSSLGNQVAAPGSAILSTSRTGGTEVMGGTSMASPLVAGAVALMQDAAQTYGGRWLTPDEVQQIVRETSTVITDSNNPNNGRVARSSLNDGFQQSDITALNETGQQFFRVNVNAAVRRVREILTGASPVDPNPTPPPTAGDTNNTTATAVVVPDLTGTRIFTADGSIGFDGNTPVGNNDVDLVELTLQSPGSIIVNVDPVAGGQNFDAYARLFNANGVQIAFADDTNGLYPVLNSGQIAAGTYYVGISSYSNTNYSVTKTGTASGGTGQGNYRLTISLDNPDPNGVVTGSEFVPSLPQLYPGLIGSDPPPINGTERVQIGGQDVDMFTVTAPDSGVLTIDVDSVETVGNVFTFDTFVRVFDDFGNEIAFNDDSGFTTDSFLTVSVARGEVVHVAVSQFGNSSYDPFTPYGRTIINQPYEGQYELYLSFDNGDQNGTVFDSYDLSLIGTTVNGTIGADFGSPVGQDGSLDVDFLTYVPTTSGLIDLKAVGGGSFVPQLALWIWDTVQQDVVRVGETAGAEARLAAPVAAGTSYFISITGLGNAGYQWFAPASGSGGLTGNYTLTALWRPTSELASYTDNSLNSGTPTAVAPGQMVRGELGLDGVFVTGDADVDLYTYTAKANGVLTVTTVVASEEDADTVVRVFNADGTEIRWNDDRTDTDRGSQIVFPVTAGFTYTIGVNGYSLNSRDYDPITGTGAAAGIRGTYTLTLSQDNTPEPQYALFSGGFLWRRDGDFWTSVAGGVAAVSDPVFEAGGARVRTVRFANGFAQEYREDFSWRNLAGNVRDAVPGRESTFVLFDDNSLWSYHRPTANWRSLGGNVAGVSVGQETDGTELAAVRFAGGFAWQYRPANNAWSPLASNVQSVDVGSSGMTAVLFNGGFLWRYSAATGWAAVASQVNSVVAGSSPDGQWQFNVLFTGGFAWGVNGTGWWSLASNVQRLGRPAFGQLNVLFVGNFLWNYNAFTNSWSWVADGVA